MSGISTAGHRVTLTRTQALTGQESITFLRHLHGYLGRRLLVVWDGASIHRSDEVKAFLANGWAKRFIWNSFQPMHRNLILMKAFGNTLNMLNYATFAAWI